jgi:hypothetical protein
MIFASVRVLVVRSSRSKALFLVEILQFIFREFVNDAPHIFRFVMQDVCDATSALERLKRKGEAV